MRRQELMAFHEVDKGFFITPLDRAPYETIKAHYGDAVSENQFLIPTS